MMTDENEAAIGAFLAVSVERSAEENAGRRRVGRWMDALLARPRGSDQGAVLGRLRALRAQRERLAIHERTPAGFAIGLVSVCAEALAVDRVAWATDEQAGRRLGGAVIAGCAALTALCSGVSPTLIASDQELKADPARVGRELARRAVERVAELEAEVRALRTTLDAQRTTEVLS